jgi:hypothetical protein
MIVDRSGPVFKEKKPRFGAIRIGMSRPLSEHVRHALVISRDMWATGCNPLLITAISGMPVCGMDSRQRPDNLPMPKIDARTRYLHMLNKFVMVWNSVACAEPPVYVLRPVRHTCTDQHGPLMECTRVLSGRRAPGQTLEEYQSIYIKTRQTLAA